MRKMEEEDKFLEKIVLEIFKKRNRKSSKFSVTRFVLETLLLGDANIQL